MLRLVGLLRAHEKVHLTSANPLLIRVWSNHMAFESHHRSRQNVHAPKPSNCVEEDTCSKQKSHILLSVLLMEMRSNSNPKGGKDLLFSSHRIRTGRTGVWLNFSMGEIRTHDIIRLPVEAVKC